MEHRLRTTRRARYYTLGGDGAVTSAWVVCHGFGQLAASFVEQFAGIATPSRRIIAPEALNRFYLNTDRDPARSDDRVGATWMTREDREAEIADYVDFLDAVRIEAVPAGVPVTALGFSQGVATVTRWAALGAKPLARLVLWAGKIPPELDVVQLALRAGEGIVLACGSGDEVNPWVDMQRQRERLAAASVPFDDRRFEGGHRLDRALLAALATD